MRVSFLPTRHGFAFTNDFVNPIAIAGIPIAHTRDRSGGMAFAALDHWHHRLPVPQATALPPEDTPIADYLRQRLTTSIVNNWFLYFHLMRTPDIGLARITREDEFPKLKTELDQGFPQPLALVRVRDPDALGNDHQVVAYGYEHDDTHVRVFIWDNRYPRREDVLTFTTMHDPHDLAVHQSNGEDWRGFFVPHYSPQHPWYLADGKLLREESDDRVCLVHRGAKFWITSPAEVGRHASEVAELPCGSLSYVDDLPGDGALLRETDKTFIVYGGAGFPIPDPDTLGRLAGGAAVQTLPRDGISALRTIPFDGTLLREEFEPAVYLVEDGMLRYVPDAETFAAQGFRWERVGVVPNGALAAVPLGKPLPPVHAPAWTERAHGTLLTGDGDRIAYTIEAGINHGDWVEFVLTQADGLARRKEIVLHADGSRWTIDVQDATRAGLPRHQLPAAGLTLRKAELFGIMTSVLDLHELDRLPEGARVTFTWLT